MRLAVAACRAPRPLQVWASARAADGSPSAQRTPSMSPVRRLVGLTRDPNAPPMPHTIYTLRVGTGLARGAALDDYNAGVVVCLVGANGDAYLQRLQPLADAESRHQELVAACSSLDSESDAGANCRLSLATLERQRTTAASSHSAAPAVKRRFQEGSIDEICFPGPELGPLTGLLIAPEAGRWMLDEVDVSSSRTGHTDRFICREALGDRGTKPAAFLTPVPPGAVVYGSGDSAVVLSRDQASQLHAFHMQQYSTLKTQLLNLTAVLVGVGSGATLAVAGPAYALPFALGGCSALLYQFLLQQGVDGIGATGPALATANPPRLQPGLELSAKLALTNPAVRIGITAGGLLASFSVLHVMAWGQAGHPDGALEFRQIVAAMSGFLMYKLAITMAVFLPPQQSSLLSSAGASGDSVDRVQEE